MVFVLVVLLIQAAQQAPPRDTKTNASAGSALLAGHVVDAETGAPIPGATVRIAARVTIGERPAEGVTGPRGEFRITDLAAGDYIVLASPPELRATHLPQVFNGDLSTVLTGGLKPSLHLNDGEVRDDVVIRLPRAFAIDGVVLDEFGEPMADVTVAVEAVQTPPFGSARAQQTDDRGMFRLFGLSPGSYRVCASPSGTEWRPIAGELTQRRYVKSCYPSAPSGSGERVSVSASRATPTLTIVMQRSQGYTITGSALSESGAKNVRVSLERIEDRGSTGVPVEMQEGGRFIARGVPSGRYNLSAYAGEGSGDFSLAERARTTVEIAGADVAGVELVTSKGATILGQIVPAEPLPPGTRLRVQQAIGLIGVDSFTGPSRSAQVRPDLTFEMTGVHDKVLFDVSGLPPGWVLASIRYRGADVTHTSVPAASTTQPRELEIHVSPRSGRIVARPVGVDGNPVLGALAFLLPVKGDRVSMQSVLSGPKPTDDGYDLGAVYPGSYVAVAVLIGDLMQISREPARLEQLRQLGRSVEVIAGERIKVDVVVRPLPEVR